MSAEPERIDPRVAEQTTKNLKLTARFLREVLADPAKLEQLPDRATFVLMPPDDPELAAANFALAERASRQQEPVTMFRVGVATPDHPRWEPTALRTLTVRSLQPRWADDLDPTETRVVYDADRDVLLLDLAGGRRTGAAIPMGGYLLLLVDLDTQEAFGNLVVGFLRKAVRRTPRLAYVLAAAELRPLTTDELGGLVPPDAEAIEREAEPRPVLDVGDIEALMGDLGTLTA
jgi:hypothetical protein